MSLGTAAAKGSRKNPPSGRKRLRVGSAPQEVRGLTTKTTVSRASEPSASSSIIRNLDTKKVVRIPFDTCTIPVYSSAGGVPYLVPPLLLRTICLSIPMPMLLPYSLLGW